MARKKARRKSRYGSKTYKLDGQYVLTKAERENLKDRQVREWDLKTGKWKYY